MTRVCHMTSVHPWNDVRIFHKECRSLATQGFEVHLVACAPESFCRNGVNVHAVAKAEGGRLARMLVTATRVYRAAKKLNADIYHFHDPELIPLGLLLKWSGKKVVYDVHEDVPRDILSKPWVAPWIRKTLSHVFQSIEDYAARRFSSIVAATPHIAKRFAGLNRLTVNVNNYPVDTDFPPQVRDGMSASRKICYVGGIATIRGAFEMVRAMEYVDATLILAGPFQDAVLERELRALPGWSKVDYRGVVDRDGVAEIFSESRLGLVMLHPVVNYLDALPVKMFEYMSAGLPVLASNFPFWKNLLDAAGAGICVDPLDPRAIAAGINELLDDQEKARVMGEAGRKAVSTTYRWRYEADKLIGLYDELRKR